MGVSDYTHNPLIRVQKSRSCTQALSNSGEMIDADLTREQQIEYVTTGTGFAGTSINYLRSIQEKFTALGIHDEEATALLRDAEAHLRSG